MTAVRMKILIVDDHAGMRDLMRGYLPEAFDEIHECEDGADAVECYERHAPDWVLMDWKMKRMDGIAATRQIIAADPQARILLVTSYDDDVLRAAARDAGARGFIVKENLRELSQILTAS